MLKSLKKIVIILGIIIVSLTVIIIVTLFNRLGNVAVVKKEADFENGFLIEKQYKIHDFSVDNGKIYFLLYSQDKKIIRVYKINNGNLLKEYYLK